MGVGVRAGGRCYQVQGRLWRVGGEVVRAPGGRGQINCRLYGGVSVRRGGSVTVNSDKVCLAAGQH